MNKVELHRALTRVLAARIPRDCVGDVELLRDYIENSEPVKHGRWIRKHNSFPQRYFCTKCGGGDVGRFAFCHHCGVEMDGDSDDEP